MLRHEASLASTDEAHPDPRGLACDLAREPLGAGPCAKTPVIVGSVGALQIAMRTPAVFILGAGEFGAATQLRTAGKAAGKIRTPAVTKRGENVAAADLVAEEMR